MAKIISIATALPDYEHSQQQLLKFMIAAYGGGEKESRILSYLYKQSGIEKRYSVMPDFTCPTDERKFFPKSPDLEPFPGLDHRMQYFAMHALPLALKSAETCIDGNIEKDEITHLISISCTGMSTPGLELQLMEAMKLRTDITRTAINFMGCYAAIHGLKMANDIVNANPHAKVLIVSTELCTIHFQKTFTEDSITAPVLFGDGSAAALVCANSDPHNGICLNSFYSEVLHDSKECMTWNLSSRGFLMTLSPDVPEIIHSHIGPLRDRAIMKAGISKEAVRHWCIHPGGKRILQAIAAGLSLTESDLAASYDILRRYGNMSSATILFVLNEMWAKLMADKGTHIFGAAFGPGLTMESIIMTAC